MAGCHHFIIYPAGKGFTFFSSVDQSFDARKVNPVLSGFITDKNSMQPLCAAISVEDSSGKTILKTVSDSVSGPYSFQIPARAYTVSVLK